VPNQIRRAVRAGATLWWTNAVLIGTVTPDEAVSHVKGDVLVPTRTWAKMGSSSLPLDSDRSPWPVTWGWLRRHECHGLRLVIPRPGDPLGMSGPPETTSAAIDSGCALICDQAGVALIPQKSDIWHVREVGAGLPEGGLGTIGEARRSMREAMTDVSQVLPAMSPDQTDLARIDQARRTKVPTAPRGIDPKAAELAASAVQVWQFVEIALDSAHVRGHVPRELVDLNRNARRALAVAFSHPLTKN
jgi:hypothetical protein